jgi:hypothetical protein
MCQFGASQWGQNLLFSSEQRLISNNLPVETTQAALLIGDPAAFFEPVLTADPKGSTS